MIDVDARARHEAGRLREEAGRIADTETALQSVLAGEVVVPLERRHPAAPRSTLARRFLSRRRWMQIVAAIGAAAVVVAVLASLPSDDTDVTDTAATSSAGLVVQPLDPPIDCGQDVCPSLAVSPEGILVAYDRDRATLTWFDDGPRVVPITVQLSGTDTDGDPELVAIGPEDVAYFLTWGPNELVAVAPTGAEITRRDWTYGHNGVLLPTASGLVATRCTFIKNRCTGGTEWPASNAALAMPWVDLVGNPLTDTRPYPAARGTDAGIEVRLGERQWFLAGEVWEGRPRPALFARSDGGVVVLLDTFDEDRQPMTLLELSPDGTIDRYFVALNAQDRLRAVLPDGSLIVDHNLVRVAESEDAPPAATAMPPTSGAPSTTSAAREEPTEVTAPAARDWLGPRSDEVAFVVRSTKPAYWRLGALSDFDGASWGLHSNVPLSEIDGPLAPGFEPEVNGGERLTQTLEITGLDGPWLPAAFSPVRFEGPADVLFDVAGSSLVVESGTANGVEYSVDSLIPRYDPASLRAADAAPTGILAEEHLALPADFPAELAEQARSVTAGATTRYDQAIALQRWFRGFTYDLSFSPGNSQDAMVEFVAERRGYCEQFAGTFAALARVLGLPSRVAVGFTPGEQAADGRYYVRGEHAHAWPEIYFEGVGWVPFEPTPGRGIPAAEQYTGVPAAQSDDDGSTITTTSAQP